MTLTEAWPALPFEEWRDTAATLHMWTQIVGKTRMAWTPAVNHWWHVPLYLTARGLGTSSIPHGTRSFEVELDFIDHALLVRTQIGPARSIALSPRSVADFYREYTSVLRALGIEPRIWPHPVEIQRSIRFDEDHEHASYDAAAANRFWRALSQADRVLKEFRGRFLGKCSPVHFFWGGFDLACTRFSGRPAPKHPGGIPNCPDYVAEEGYSHECASAGWWPGSPAGQFDEPAFYAYSYPEPAGYDEAPVRPAPAYYERNMRLWILPYEAVRTMGSPDQALLEFFQSTYEAAANRGNWDRTALERHRA